MTSKQVKQSHKSLGVAAKKRDYEGLLEELQSLDLPENSRLKQEWFAREEDMLASEMDKLLLVLLQYLKPPVEKEEEDPNAQWGAGANQQGGPMNVGGVNVGAAIAPSMGAMGRQDSVYREIFVEDLDRTEIEVPQAALDCIAYLLKNGVDPNQTIAEGLTATMLACTINNTKPLEMLVNNDYVEKDINLNEYEFKGLLTRTDKIGHNVLAYALFSRSFLMADYLINEKGLDVNEKFFRFNGQTLLHVAAERFNYKSDFSATQGWLYELEKNSNEDVIVYLLSMGADTSISDNNGNVPEELIPFKDDDLIEVLGNISPEEEACWERCYQMIGNNRKELVKKEDEFIKFDF